MLIRINSAFLVRSRRFSWIIRAKRGTTPTKVGVEKDLLHKGWNLAFKIGDLVDMLQRQTNTIQAIHHAVAAEAINFKMIGFITSSHGLSF